MLMASINEGKEFDEDELAIDIDEDYPVDIGGLNGLLTEEISQRKALQSSFEEFQRSTVLHLQKLSQRCAILEGEAATPDEAEISDFGHGVSRRAVKRGGTLKLGPSRSKTMQIQCLDSPEADVAEGATARSKPKNQIASIAEDAAERAESAIQKAEGAIEKAGSTILDLMEEDNTPIDIDYSKTLNTSPDGYTKRDRPTELPLFAFTKAMGVKRSVTVLAMSIVCVVVKALLVCIVGDYLTVRQISEKTVADIWEWRTTNAHDIKFMSILTSESLARRVCDGHGGLQMSSVPANLLALLQRYRPEDIPDDDRIRLVSHLKTAGAMTCALALTIWGTTVLIKARSLLELAVSLWAVPTAPGDTRWKPGSDGGLCLVSVPMIRKLAWVLFFVAEIGILLPLALIGCQYILFDFDPTGLILNCAALALIEDLDNMAFAALLPEGCQQASASIAVPCVPHRSSAKFFIEWIIGATLLAAATGLYAHEQIQLADLIDRARFALCGGNLDFVFAMDPGGAVVAAGLHPEFSRAVTDRYLFRAVKELVESDTALNGNVETSLSDGAIGSHYGQLSVDLRTKISFGDRMSGLNPECNDFSGGVAVWPSSFTEMLIEDEYNGPVPHCHNASKFCSADNALGLRMRQWCPVTCGCNSPSSSQVMLFDNGGCPPPCFASTTYSSGLANRPCEDEPPDSPDFLEYMEGVRQLAASYTSPDWVDRFNSWIEQLQAGGCNRTQLTPAVFGTLCGGNAFNLKPLQYVCPVACGCPLAKPPSGFPTLCPSTC